MRMQPLPGFVPSLNTLQAKQAAGDVREQASETKKQSLRADFATALEQRLSGWLGEPDSEKFKNLMPLAKPYLRQGTGEELLAQVDLSKLPESAQEELVKLQKATENIESLFVKKLLSQMRSVSFDGEKHDQMTGFAQDLMDQSIADRAAKSGSSIGISKMIFLDTAQTIVRSAIAKPLGNKDKQ